MAIFQLLLFVLLALNMSAMFSGFMLARRMVMYLMTQVMMLMLAMFIGIGALVVGVFFPPIPAQFDLLHIIILADFVFILLATLMEFVQVFPILLKTMQGGPIHSSHMTNLLVSFFLTLALALFYEGLAIL